MTKYRYIINLALGIMSLSIISMENQSPRAFKLQPLFPELDTIFPEKSPESLFSFKVTPEMRAITERAAAIASAISIQNTITKQEPPNIKQTKELAQIKKPKSQLTQASRACVSVASAANISIAPDSQATIQRGIKRTIIRTFKARTLSTSTGRAAQSSESDSSQDYEYETDEDSTTDSQASSTEASVGSQNFHSDSEEETASSPKKRPAKKLKASIKKACQKYYKCQHKKCLASFTKQSALIRHVRIHTKNKPYQCTKCDFKSAEKGNLNRHYNDTHMNLRSYQCTTCLKEFKRKTHLEQHQATHD